MPKDRQRLKQRLCSTLGWDEVVVDGVIEAIASAESAEEAEAIVQVCSLCWRGRGSNLTFHLHHLDVRLRGLQDYMGGGAEQKQLVHDFLRAQGRPFANQGTSQLMVRIQSDCE